MKLTVVVGLAMLLAACQASPPVPEPVVSPTAAVAPQELSATASTARFALATTVMTRVRVQILTIENPTQQALTLTISVDDIGVGAVAVHPPAEPAEYLLDLPDDAADRIKAGNAHLEVSLAALQPGQVLRDDVRLGVVIT